MLGKIYSILSFIRNKTIDKISNSRNTNSSNSSSTLKKEPKLQKCKRLDKLNGLLVAEEASDMKNGFLKNKTTTSSLSKARSISTKNGISINKAATSIISSETTTSIKTNKKQRLVCTIV